MTGYSAATETPEQVLRLRHQLIQTKNMKSFDNGFATRFLTRVLHFRSLPVIVNIALVLGISWVLADDAMNMLGITLEEPAPVVEVQPAAPAQVTRPTVNTTSMADWHLFGIASEQEKAKVQRIVDAPETRLKLSLKGIVATDDHHTGYAIIQKPDKEEQHFVADDSVFGLATLEEIYIDRVILLRNGHYETLRLPIEFLAGDLFMERQRKQEAKRIVSDFRSKFVDGQGMELIKMFGFDTAYRNGSFAGFTVKVMGEDGARMLEVLGVEEGDLITAVNGKRFAESIEAVNSLAQLKDATGVDVEIDRKGVPLFFHFDFADLEQAADTEEPTGNTTEHDTQDPAADTVTLHPDDERTL
jgi:general secretion pathway protein C